ncbi:hypothetical protein ACFV5N_19530, partial [Streptomyces sp. NPDC059853]
RRRGVGTTGPPPRVGVDLSPSQHAWPGRPGDPWTVTAAAPAPPPPAVARLPAPRLAHSDHLRVPPVVRQPQRPPRDRLRAP